MNEKNRFSVAWYGALFILLSLNVCITCLIIRDENRKIDALKKTNEALAQQNKEMQDALYVYDMNIKEYQSATDATLAELGGDVQTLLMEMEVNESDLHKQTEVKEEIKYEYVGTYELTAYVETGNPCADGIYPSVGYTAACNDPALWHKWIHINGYGDFYVHDTGGMSSNVIDLFVGSYDEAIQFGRREAEVSIIGD